MPHAYQQVLEGLTRAIYDGRYKPGDAIPTVRELGEEYGVSTSTARQATAELGRMGLVWSSYEGGKRGTFVRSRGRTDFYMTDALHRRGKAGRSASFVENAIKVGRTPEARFTMVMRVPPADVAARLGLPADTVVVERTTLQLLDGEPWSRERSWYPMELAHECGLDSPHSIDEGTMQRLEELGYLETAHRDETTDEPANAEDATDLGVIIGSPLLVQTRTGATDERVTRVTRTIRLGGRNRLIHEHGTPAGVRIIQQQLVAGVELGGEGLDVPATINGGIQ